MRRVLGWRALVWVVVPYAAMLWWVRQLVSDPVNVDYFTRYVALRCSAGLLDGLERPTPVERLAEVDRGLRRCQSLAVEVDGVWGGLYGHPAVRLRIVPAGGTDPRFEYYSVDVSPILGTVSIRHELAPQFYYWSP